MPPHDDTAAMGANWDQAYAEGRPPWDIGQPQPVFVRLADAGEITAPVLDAGCGTGEHCLMLAERGIEVLGLDVSAVAIARAREKARERGLAAEFGVADLRTLGADALGRRFATILDSGVFHTFDDTDRSRYVASLGPVLEPDGVLHLLCFSELTPGGFGPRRVTQAELRAAFAQDAGWMVERIEPARFAVAEDFVRDSPHAWLARIERMPNEG